MKLVIKSVKPFSELTLQVAGIAKPIVVGVISHSYEELVKVREAMSEILSSDELDKVSAKLQVLLEKGDRTSDEFYENKAALLEEQKSLQSSQEQALLDFYKNQILFLKNIEITIEDKDLVIKDTREVQPIESLWVNEDEALAVLLDTYLDYVPFRDSLFKKLTDAIFNIQQDGKSKN